MDYCRKCGSELSKEKGEFVICDKCNQQYLDDLEDQFLCKAAEYAYSFCEEA